MGVAAGLAYLAVWVYELANLLSLSAFGSQASVVFLGVVPIGVSATVPSTALLALAKPAQIGLASLTMLGLLFAVRSRGLNLSTKVAVTMLSIYLASGYWELLSSLGSISYEVHLVIFSALAIVAQTALSSRLKV